MFSRLYPILENSTVDAVDEGVGRSLAKVIEVHPDLEPLLDFYGPDPIEMAHEIGMVHPLEEDGDDDLTGIDFGPDEWHEASVGVTVVQRALDGLRADPSSIGRYLYDPTLRQEDVVDDLSAILAALEDARDREIRFRLIGVGQSGMWPRPR